MQLEDLAGEIFVEAALLPQAGGRVGTDRARIVEIDQHRRMGFDRQQHVAEAPEHMRADGFALVGAADLAHIALVRRNAEMVRPEPDQPFDETDLGAERGIEACLGFIEINLLRHARTGIGPGRCRRGRLIRRFHVRWRAAGALRIGLLHRALSAPGLALRLLVGKCRAPGRTARQQVGVGNTASAGAVQIGEQSAARVGGNGGDRSGARADAEPVQGERSVGLGIAGHASMSSRLDATPPPYDGWSATAVSRLRQGTLQDHGHKMKNRKDQSIRSSAQSRAVPMAPGQSGPRKMKNAPDATSTKPMA